MPPRLLIVDDNPELLRLMSGFFEQEGYEVVQAQKARQALEKAAMARPDAAIVDLLLPDQMGHEVGAWLRSHKVPFVFMSGVFRGPRHAVEAKTRHGAADFFEKPFEVRRLLECVGRLVPGAVPRREETDRSDREAEVEGPPDEHGLVLTGRVRMTDGPGRIAVTLEGEDLHLAPQRPLPARAPDPPHPGGPAPRPAEPIAEDGRTGVLSDNLPQLVSAFHLSRLTGELDLRRGEVHKVVCFESGAPVFASSNLAGDRFGPFLVRIGKVPAEDQQAAARVAERTRRTVGDVLIEMGLLTEPERMYYVGQQVKAIVYSLFAWEDGLWRITLHGRARREALRLDVRPADLVLRGVRKLYSPARLARLMPEGACPVPTRDPPYQPGDLTLEPWEAQVLDRTDGTLDTAALARGAGRSADLVRGLLAGLISLRMLEIRAEP